MVGGSSEALAGMTIGCSLTVVSGSPPRLAGKNAVDSSFLVDGSGTSRLRTTCVESISRNVVSSSETFAVNVSDVSSEPVTDLGLSAVLAAQVSVCLCALDPPETGRT